MGDEGIGILTPWSHDSKTGASLLLCHISAPGPHLALSNLPPALGPDLVVEGGDDELCRGA